MEFGLGRALGAALLVMLGACGGGGSGGDAAPPPAPLLPLSPLSQDQIPSGARVAWGMRAPFPLEFGNSWRYQLRRAGSNTVQTVERYIAGVDGDQRVLAELEGNQRSEMRLRWTTDGLESIDPLELRGTVPALDRALPRWTELPTPLYEAGASRRLLRQGSLERDIDGDGRHDDFRLEIEQVFVGFETIPLFGRSVRVAHLRTRVSLGLGKTTLNRVDTSGGTEDAYFADGLGPVRMERSYSPAPGEPALPSELLELEQAEIDGVVHNAAGLSFALPIQVDAAAWDETRQRIIAIVSSADLQRGGRLAIIDPRSGELSYSERLGEGLREIAIAADGNSVYLGLHDSLLRLRLPDLHKLSETALPPIDGFGNHVSSLRASPVDPELVVLSLNCSSCQPRHAGVVAWRAGQWLPRRSAGGYGSTEIVFDPSGQFLLGRGHDRIEEGLHRLALRADGVEDLGFILLPGLYGANFSSEDGLILVGSQLLRYDNGLQRLGQVEGSDQCVKVAGVNRLACQSRLNWGLMPVDTGTMAALPRGQFPGNVGINSSSARLLLARPGLLVAAEMNRLVIQSDSALR